LWIAEPRGRRRTWLLMVLVFLAVGLLMSLSRGGWAGAICGMAFLFVLYGRWRVLLNLATVIVPVIAIGWILLPESSKEYATDLSGGTRLASWQDAMAWFMSSPILGVGVGLRKKYDATNIIASTLAETGVTGLLAFAAIHVVFYRMIWKARRRLPVSGGGVMLLGLGGALVLCQFVHGCVDHYWSRALLIIWSSAGMATFAHWLAVPTVRPPRRPIVPAPAFGSQPASSPP
jgi:O-antigen ligase